MQVPAWVKWVFGILVFFAATVGVIWLSGMAFYVLSKTNPIGKTDVLTGWTYWQTYQGDAVVAKRLKMSLVLAGIAGYGVPLAVLIAALREVRTLYGEARFANSREMAKAGLFGNKGIVIGKWKGKFLVFGGSQFVLLAAPTRSGKGVGMVIPNLLNWGESVVVLDVKRENYLITSGYRAKWGQAVYLFNPFALSEEGDVLNLKTHRYNPLGYISDDPRMRVTDILSIGYALYPGEGREAFFDDAARNLFLGLTLYLMETPSLPRTLGELLRQSSGKGKPVKVYLEGLIKERNYREVESADETGAVSKKLMPITKWDGAGLPPLSQECVDALTRFTGTSDNTLSSIMATFNVPLTMWASPVLDAATSANDFDLRDVRKRRMSIYLGVPANRLAEAKLIINLFYTQLINLNTNQLMNATPAIRYQCLILADEFTAPGRVGIIDKSNAYIAGYGLRLVTIIQSPGQLEAPPPRGYGKEGARTLATNHACQILFTPRKQEDANEYSEMLGYETFQGKSRSQQFGGTGNRSESVTDQKRALMLPQELKEMGDETEIIVMENVKPMKVDAIRYYKDKVFVGRLKTICPGINIEKKEEFERAWGRGHFAASVPILDLGLHEAKTQERVREMGAEDVEGGVDLEKLAVDLGALRRLAETLSGQGGVNPTTVEDFVGQLFDVLG